MHSSQRPIGYYLKQTDLALTRGIDALHQARGLTRTHWQLLNLIQESGSISKAHALENLSIFVDPAEFEQILKGLVERAWVEPTRDGQLRLSPAGQQEHLALLEAQKAFRARFMKGISQEEYTTVVEVLRKMLDNLNT